MTPRAIMPRLRLLLAALVLVLGGERLSAQGYVVVVNAANPVTSITKDRANAIFLKRVSQWENGTPAVPVNLPREAAPREAFTRHVHGKSVNAVESYWQQQIFAGKEAPPTQRQSDAEVIAFVRATPGAIGYVSSAAAVSGDVKVVTVN